MRDVCIMMQCWCSTLLLPPHFSTNPPPFLFLCHTGVTTWNLMIFNCGYIKNLTCTYLGSLIGNTQCGLRKDVSATQILREINFYYYFEGLRKTSILHIWAFFVNFCHFQVLNLPKIKIYSLQNCWNGSFWPLKIKPRLIFKTKVFIFSTL